MRLIGCGDIIFSCGALAARMDKRLLDLFGGADAVAANAEFSCPERATPPTPRRYITSVRPELLSELDDIGMTLVSFANNHTGDFGPQGVVDTIRAARRHRFICGGVGESLSEARAPVFQDGPRARISMIATSTTRAPDFIASDAGRGIPARAGMNSLRWSRHYQLPPDAFAALRDIDTKLGIGPARQEVKRIEIMAPEPDDAFDFGSVFDTSISIRRGDDYAVKTATNAQDQEAILASIRDARHRSDAVIVNLHAHEGLNDNWYDPYPAEMLTEFSHAAIDAGADVVFGHGPHMLRGIEFYKGKPIHYSLNSLIMEFEGGQTLMTPEMYESYGFGPESYPSDLHRSRAADAEGNRLGFFAEDRFSRAVVSIVDLDKGGAAQVSLVPIDLGMNRTRVQDRGFPEWASDDVAREICDELTATSAKWGTEFEFDAKSGTIRVIPGRG